MLQLGLPFPGRVRFAVEVVKSAAVPKRPSADFEVFAIAANRNRVGSVGLKLDRVRPRFLGGVNDADGSIVVLIMIRGKLGDDVNGIARSDLSRADAEGRRHSV